MGFVSLDEINFLSLPTAVFCVECELISHNNTPNCFSCGSQAILSLSRILGGTIRGQQTAHLIADAELDRLVRELLRTVPTPAQRHAFNQAALDQTSLDQTKDDDFNRVGTRMPVRHHARLMHGKSPSDAATTHPVLEMDSHELDLEPAINAIAERAQALTGATGSAIALRRGSEIVCRARTGRTAPDLGVRLQTNSGVSAECVRTGQLVLCNDTEQNIHVDLGTCRHLGVRSVLAAPLRHFPQTLGVFEVLSSSPNAFDQHDVATMQFLAGLMVAAISRISRLRSSEPVSA